MRLSTYIWPAGPALRVRSVRLQPDQPGVRPWLASMSAAMHSRFGSFLDWKRKQFTQLSRERTAAFIGEPDDFDVRRPFPSRQIDALVHSWTHLLAG